jgi:preprotein translocase subunit SecG
MQKRIADHRRRVARLNRYVIVVALLWLVTSVALLFLSRPQPANLAHSTSPASHSTDRANTTSLPIPIS